MSALVSGLFGTLHCTTGCRSPNDLAGQFIAECQMSKRKPALASSACPIREQSRKPNGPLEAVVGSPKAGVPRSVSADLQQTPSPLQRSASC